jgi:drug/metabolite transporter (DMT)-like permease
VRTSLVGTYAYVNPIVAVLLGWLVLGETLPLRDLVAAGIVLSSVALIVSAGGTRRTDSGRDERGPEVKAEVGFNG